MADGPDARRPITDLRKEWSACVKCVLGQQRIDRDAQFVFGQGVPRSILFVGDGPDLLEEEAGEPFISASGKVLRGVLAKLGVDQYYLTNAVCCRPCSPQLDAEGQPVFRKNWKTKVPMQVYRDETPTPAQTNACKPRLYEEIYLIDPIVIVGLGAKACEVLLGKTINLSRDHGEPSQISIPGASWVPILTDKKREWLHKVKGEYVQPVERNEVRYHFVPTWHPSDVMRKLADQGPDSPFRQFIGDIKKAVKTYETYAEIAFGAVPKHRDTVSDEDVQRQMSEETEPT